VNRVEITLKQDGQSIVLDHDDSPLLAGLTENLRNDMALVVSNYDIGLDSDIQNGQCPRNSICGDYTSTLKNFEWTSDDSIVPDEIATGDVADSLEDCGNPDCTTCHETWYLSDPTDISYQCTDFRRMKYSNLCRDWKNKDNLCGVDDICLRSWPETDSRKWRSNEAACRPLPESLIEGEFKYAKRTCKSNKGLCGLGCGEGETCYNSYPIDDPLKWKSPHAICRCKPDDL